MLFLFYKHFVKTTSFKGVIWKMVNKGRNSIESHIPTINLAEMCFMGEVIVVSIYSLRLCSQGWYCIEGDFCGLRLRILQSFDWLAAFRLELLQAILFVAVYLSAPVFLATCLKYCGWGLPTAFFPDIAPSRMSTTHLLCLIVCPIHEWHLFFKIFKSNLSSFALWKTSSIILAVHFISNILLQHHVSNAFMTLCSFFPRVHVSDP